MKNSGCCHICGKNTRRSKYNYDVICEDCYREYNIPKRIWGVDFLDGSVKYYHYTPDSVNQEEYNNMEVIELLISSGIEIPMNIEYACRRLGHAYKIEETEEKIVKTCIRCHNTLITFKNVINDNYGYTETRDSVSSTQYSNHTIYDNRI